MYPYSETAFPAVPSQGDFSRQPTVEMSEIAEVVRKSRMKRRLEHEDAASTRPTKKSKANTNSREKRSRGDDVSRAMNAQQISNNDKARERPNGNGEVGSPRTNERIASGDKRLELEQLEKDEIEMQRKGAIKASKAARKAAQRKKQQDADSLIPVQRRWTLSSPGAGRFLDHDPVFVQDQAGHDFLITANGREIQLLDLETSLVVRTFPAPGKTVSCFSLDSANADFVLIGYSDGSITRWNWTSDSHVGKETLKDEKRIIAISSASTDADTSLFYVGIVGRQHAILSNRRRLLFATKSDLRSLQVLGSGEYVVSRASKAIVLGMKQESDYNWIEIPLSTASTCADARILPQASNNKKNKPQPGLSLAIAHENGQIHLFSDVSSIFNDKFRQQSLPAPQILHWHREAVSSVKFSRDGNYLISGGKETVLVLWQLSTSKQQFLPHLTSEIDRIVVNQQGDRYAVQLGDNSVMVLSTSELKPVAHVAGLQMSAMQQTQLAAVLNPRRPNQLLLTVSASRPHASGDATARPFLQNFDTRHSRHISRQALTRNNVTDLNIGPERNPIIPPDVFFLAISHDGNWLATVDEWMPPRSDLKHLSTEDSDVELEQQRRREVYLKIWSWNEREALWTLSTRMDAPHVRANGETLGAGRVLALEADPVSKGFATIGEDGSVKFWTPKKRTRHGVVLTDAQNVDVVEWRCRRVTPLPRATAQLEPSETRPVAKASLAYSGDGSLLAVSQRLESADEAPVVHFVDTSSGLIAASKAGLANSKISAIGFLERYFIAVSQPAAYVWDLVSETLVYKAKLADSAMETALAVNTDDGTFALVSGRKKVEIYEPKDNKCLYSHTFGEGVPVEGVLSGKGTKGYVLIFEDGTIRTIASTGGTQALSLGNGNHVSPALPAPKAVEAETEDTAASGFDVRLLKDPGEQEHVGSEESAEDDRPVVRPEHLASIFDVAQSYAMPPVKDMFQAVVGLFGHKPLPKLIA